LEYEQLGNSDYMICDKSFIPQPWAFDDSDQCERIQFRETDHLSGNSTWCHITSHPHIMLNTEFTSWLHGFFVLAAPQSLTSAQIRIIRAHIDLCHEVCNGALTVVNSWIHNDLKEGKNDQLQNLMRLVARDFNRKPLVSGTEVAYFIQGFFEIESTERTNSLTVSQCKEIKLMMNRNVDGIESSLLDFYWEVRAVLGSGDVNATLDTASIKERVNSLFQHVIDPSYGFSEERNAELQLIHSGMRL
jgi:hypothetical protein